MAEHTKTTIILLLVVCTVLGGIGQFLFKLGFTNGQLLLTVGAGLGVYLVSTAIYFYVLSRVHLSWAYGMNGISYILAVVLAATVLAENVPLLRWAGVLVIAVGVALVSVS